MSNIPPLTRLISAAHDALEVPPLTVVPTVKKSKKLMSILSKPVDIEINSQPSPAPLVPEEQFIAGARAFQTRAEALTFLGKQGGKQNQVQTIIRIFHDIMRDLLNSSAVRSFKQGISVHTPPYFYQEENILLGDTVPCKINLNPNLSASSTKSAKEALITEALMKFVKFSEYNSQNSTVAIVKPENLIFMAYKQKDRYTRDEFVIILEISFTTENLTVAVIRNLYEGYTDAPFKILNLALARNNLHFNINGLFYTFPDGEELKLSENYSEMCITLGLTTHTTGALAASTPTIHSFIDWLSKSKVISKDMFCDDNGTLLCSSTIPHEQSILDKIALEIQHWGGVPKYRPPMTHGRWIELIPSITSQGDKFWEKINRIKEAKVLANKYTAETFIEALGPEPYEGHHKAIKIQFEAKIAKKKDLQFFLQSSSRETILKAIQDTCDLTILS